MNDERNPFGVTVGEVYRDNDPRSKDHSGHERDLEVLSLTPYDGAFFNSARYARVKNLLTRKETRIQLDRFSPARRDGYTKIADSVEEYKGAQP